MSRAAYLAGVGSASKRERPGRGRRGGVRRFALALGAGVVVAALGLVAAIVWWSGATLAGDATALARVDLQPLGGSLVSARAFGPGGAPIPLAVRKGRLLPTTLLSPGEAVTVVVVVRRPGWLGWALGRSRSQRLTLHAPTSRPTQQWPTIAAHAALRLHFDAGVDRVSYELGSLRKTISAHGSRTVSLGPQAPSGTLEVSTAARSWERFGTPVRVTWFPASRLPVVLVNPRLGHPISPRDQIRLTFSQPLEKALGSARPRFVSGIGGSWRATDSHTLLFSPRGFGFPLASALHLELPRVLSLSAGASTPTTVRTIQWKVAGAGFTRLQQLLADAGYLPLVWHAAGAPVARQPLAEINAAVYPPAGTFSWRYPNTPSELQRLWSVGQPNQIIRGAVMMFQHDHGLAVDGIAGAHVWQALLADAVAGKQRTDGYSYVYVHRNLPQLLTLWHNGQTVLTSPGNTGVPAAPTQLGTFPVFEHIPIGTMSGTNPDGSHYNDPGIRWISYFNGGDALHS
ncbi:MAG: hypothetical protein QOI14_1809, partial [Actinomycetota bacterium]|nr:hypothetical protein [Actinomycetota bacterium]